MLATMEELFDMHCHLGFTPDPAATATAGAADGISAFACTVEPAEYQRLLPVLASSANVALGLGAHPWWIADGRVVERELEEFYALAPAAPFIGEIGLDFAGDRDTPESRALLTSAFARILDACNQGADGKLLSLHAVKSADTVLDLLEQAGTLARHRVIFHWFSGTSDDLARAVRAGCFFSVGPRMLASRRGREYARQIPLPQLVLETDGPPKEEDSLPPEVWRAELGNALAGISQLKQMNRDELAAHLAETSRLLLGL